MGNVKFNNISSIDLGLIVQTKPNYDFPSKDVEVTHIPGRNGDLVIDKKSWKNVNRTYSIASVFKRGTDFIANSEKIIGWLTSAEGYARLEDSYDPDVYRLAQFNSSGSLPNLYDEATVINITFDCKPQRYLKSGEKIYTFTNDDCMIFNSTEYEALPIITIEGIQNDSNTVLLLSIEDDKNDKTSIITISLPEDKQSATINSMEQTIYDSEENLEKYISLNGKGFPVLKSGDNTIKLTKYENISEEVKSFDKVIDENDDLEVNKVLYLPYDTQIEAKQKKFSIKSFDALKASKMETYEGESYFSLLYNKSEEYEFISFNQILESYGRKYETTLDSEIIFYIESGNYIFVSGSLPNDAPEWLVFNITEVESAYTEGSRIYYKVKKIRIGVWTWPSDTMIEHGEKDMQGDYEFSTFLGERNDRYYAFWYLSNKNPNITFRTSSTKILESGRQPLYLDDEYKPGESISLTFFTAYADRSVNPGRGYTGRPYINLDYSFITNIKPYWVNFVKNYKYPYTSTTVPVYECNNSTLDSISYIAHSFGLYYIPKKDGILGMFTKDKWKYCDDYDNFILDELKWNNNKQAFVKSSGLSVSTTDSFAYRFCQFNPDPDESWQTYPQYEDVIEQELDANGNPVRDANGNIKTKIVSKCHFKVIGIHGKNQLNPLSHGDYLESVTFASKENGYYLTEDDQTKWKLNELKFSDNSSILKVTSGILVNYLEDIPTYQDEEGFPEEYINTELFKSDGSLVDINDTEVYFKSKKVGWYSYIYYDENEGKNQQTDWCRIINSGNIIDFDRIIESKNNIDLCFITTDSSQSPIINIELTQEHISSVSNKKGMYIKKIHIEYELDSEIGVDKTWEYEFTSRIFGSGSASDDINPKVVSLSDITTGLALEWTLIYRPATGKQYYGSYTSTKGQQFGSNTHPSDYISLYTTSIQNATIKNVWIEVSGNAGTTAKIKLTLVQDQWTVNDIVDPNITDNNEQYVFYHEGGTHLGTGSDFPVVHYKAVIYNETSGEEETIDHICFKDKNNDDIVDDGQEQEDGVVYTKPSDWLKVTIQHDSDSNIDKFVFKLGDDQSYGYFKINSKSNWTRYDDHVEPIHSAVIFTEDSTISFIQDMPEYSDFSIPIKADVSYSTTGNPETVTITTTESGYYRLESSVNWEYKSAEEVLVETKSSDSTAIKYLQLDEDQSSLDNVIIKIKPNWWKL